MKGKGWFWFGVVPGLLLLGLVIWLGPTVSAAVRAGFLEKQEDRTIEEGQTLANLKTVHQAILMYSESEGVLPDAGGWMDAAYTRLKTADLPEAEAKKLLKAKKGLAEDEYGFAMNTELSGKDPFDPSLQEKFLIFESSKLEWNAKGLPGGPEAADHKEAQGITLGGTLKPLGTGSKQ